MEPIEWIDPPQSAEEFIRLFTNGGVIVVCNTPERRDTLLRYLVDCGIQLSRVTASYLMGIKDSSFLCPMYDSDKGYVVCFTRAQSRYKNIGFRSIEGFLCGDGWDLDPLQTLFDEGGGL